MLKALYVRDVPPALKRRLIERASDEGANLNDTACTILAEHFNKPYEPTGRAATTRVGDAPDMVLKLSVPLYKAVQMQAVRAGGTMRGVVLNTLAQSFGLPPTAVGRRPRGSVAR